MGSESSDAVDNGVKVSTRSCASKKSSGKVPRKIHKAAREKLKRDHMNDLFLDLEKTLDLDNPNNGKASILRETVRLLGELLAQVDSLKKENEHLLSESNYATIEKNELLEDTSALDAQIRELKREIDEKANCSNVDVSQPHSNAATAQLPDNHVAFPNASDSTPLMAPVYLMPFHHESQGFASSFPEGNLPKVPSNVSRPQPRYPSPSDSWPSDILTRQTNVAEEV